MTAREMMDLIDRTGMMWLEEFEIEVIVLDVRTNFGATQVKVRPVQGKGEKWTPLDRLVLVGR